MNKHPIFNHLEFDDDGNLYSHGILRLGKVWKNRYRRFKVTINGKQYWKYLHRLIWEAFYGPVPEGCIIMHHDEFLPFPYRDAPFNLFLGNTSVNARDTFFKGRKGTGGKSFGKANGNSK